MRELVLPSGATLKITPAEFIVSKALFQAVSRELRSVRGANIDDILKDIFCASIASPEIEACVWECFKRCLYNSGAGDFKITADTFEAVERRVDYVKVCIEVAKDNITPFVKSLYAELSGFRLMLENIQL